MKRSLLRNVGSDKDFMLVDGTTIKDMRELLSALEKMDEDTFTCHVNKEKNDFHNWARDVHQDEKLASMLSQVIDRESTTAAIRRRIREIEKPSRDRVSGGSRNFKSKRTRKENKRARNPFPKPVARHKVNHRTYEIIVTVIAVVFIISLIGISSQAVQITGAVVGSPLVQEVQFLGLGGVFAVVVLLFAALHAIEKHAKNEMLRQ